MGEPQAPGCAAAPAPAATSPVRDPPPGPRLRPEVRKVRRCHRAGWDGRERGEGRREVGTASGIPQPECAEGTEGAERAEPRGPPSPAIVAGTAPGPAATLPPFRGSLLPRLPRAGPREPRPRAVGSALRLAQVAARPPAAVIVHRAPPTSTAPTAPASTPGLRARRLGPRLRRARRLRAARAARGARLLIPAGGGGAGARAGLAVAGRGPSHQRWRGAEGRAEQAGWVGSGLRVAMAASTPGRARLAQGGAAQSGGRPRPRPAPRPSARSPAPSLEPPPPRPARGK